MTLADDIKRLRDLESALSVADIISINPSAIKDTVRAVNLPDAIRTINALVDLVGEMTFVLHSSKDAIDASYIQGLGNQLRRDVYRYKAKKVKYNSQKRSALKKAAPIAALAKGE